MGFDFWLKVKKGVAKVPFKKGVAKVPFIWISFIFYLKQFYYFDFFPRAISDFVFIFINCCYYSHADGNGTGEDLICIVYSCFPVFKMFC